jgi:hypothetical protein
MASYSKLILSGSTDGKGILVNVTETTGIVIHTCSTDSGQLDEIWLYAYNGHTLNVTLTVEFGGVTVPNNVIVCTIPTKAGLYLVVPGLILKGNATPLIVAAFASTTNVISITGWVNRIVV